MDSIGFDWIRLDSIGFDWIGLDWIGLDRIRYKRASNYQLTPTKYSIADFFRTVVFLVTDTAIPCSVTTSVYSEAGCVVGN